MKKLCYIMLIAVIAACMFGCPRRGATPDEQMIKFTAAGEVRPSAAGNPLFQSGDATTAMPDVLPFLVERDLVMSDFGGGVELGCQPLLREEVLRWKPEWLSLLYQTNIRVLNLANDHSLDCGRDALSRSMSNMLSQGFYIFGAGKDQKEAHSPVYLTVKGVTISVVGFLFHSPPGLDPCDDCTGPSFYDRQALINSLKEMKRRADHRLVVFHWEERESAVLSEKEMAAVREAFDFGADLVLGYGPETAGSIQRIRGKWAIGSVGRLTGEDSAGGGANPAGMMVSMEFTRSGINNLRLIATDLDNGRPRLLRGEEGTRTLNSLVSASSDEVQDNVKIIKDILYLK